MLKRAPNCVCSTQGTEGRGRGAGGRQSVQYHAEGEVKAGGKRKFCFSIVSAVRHPKACRAASRGAANMAVELALRCSVQKGFLVSGPKQPPGGAPILVWPPPAEIEGAFFVPLRATDAWLCYFLTGKGPRSRPQGLNSLAVVVRDALRQKLKDGEVAAPTTGESLGLGKGKRVAERLVFGRVYEVSIPEFRSRVSLAAGGGAPLGGGNAGDGVPADDGRAGDGVPTVPAHVMRCAVLGSSKSKSTVVELTAANLKWCYQAVHAAAELTPMAAPPKRRPAGDAHSGLVWSRIEHAWLARGSQGTNRFNVPKSTPEGVDWDPEVYRRLLLQGRDQAVAHLRSEAGSGTSSFGCSRTCSSVPDAGLTDLDDSLRSEDGDGVPSPGDRGPSSGDGVTPEAESIFLDFVE